MSVELVEWMETESRYSVRVALALPGVLLAFAIPYNAGLRSGAGLQAVRMLGAFTYPIAFQYVFFGLYLRFRGVRDRSISDEGPSGALSTPLGRTALGLWLSAVVVVSIIAVGGPFDGGQWIPVASVAATSAITGLYLTDLLRREFL